MKKELVINPYAPEGFYDEKIVLNRQGELIKRYVISPKSKPSVLFNDRYSLKEKSGEKFAIKRQKSV